jgi:hypothetical protein
MTLEIENCKFQAAKSLTTNSSAKHYPGGIAATMVRGTIAYVKHNVGVLVKDECDMARAVSGTANNTGHIPHTMCTGTTMKSVGI